VVEVVREVEEVVVAVVAVAVGLAARHTCSTTPCPSVTSTPT
jgi:hypothetical protein